MRRTLGEGWFWCIHSAVRRVMGVVIEQSGSSPYLGARCENIFIHNIDPGTIKNMITYFGSQQRNANEIFILDGAGMMK